MFDAALAIKVAKRIKNIEPLAAKLLMDAVEEKVQAQLEQSDIEAHRAHYTKEYRGG